MLMGTWHMFFFYFLHVLYVVHVGVSMRLSSSLAISHSQVAVNALLKLVAGYAWQLLAYTATLIMCASSIMCLSKCLLTTANKLLTNGKNKHFVWIQRLENVAYC
jgi:hypothetical protein